MSDRWELYRSHKLSTKRNFDLEKFNKLSHEYALVSEQLDRLEDELQVILSCVLITCSNCVTIQLLLTEESIPTVEDQIHTDDSFLDF